MLFFGKFIMLVNYTFIFDASIANDMHQVEISADFFLRNFIKK
jgi:hypothetical protein